MKPVVRFVITNVHMGLGHNGLSELIRQHKKKNKLFATVMNNSDGLVLFLNTKRTAAKLFSERSYVLGYLRLRNGSRLTEKSIDLIPDSFGGALKYSSAVRSALKTFLEIEQGPERRNTLRAS